MIVIIIIIIVKNHLSLFDYKILNYDDYHYYFHLIFKVKYSFRRWFNSMVLDFIAGVFLKSITKYSTSFIGSLMCSFDCIWVINWSSFSSSKSFNFPFALLVTVTLSSVKLLIVLLLLLLLSLELLLFLLLTCFLCYLYRSNLDTKVTVFLKWYKKYSESIL